MGHKLGIDLGGTKTEVVVLNPDHEPVFRLRVPTPSSDYDAILDTVLQLVTRAESEVGVECSLGIGMPGAISPGSGLLRNANTACLNGRAFAADIGARLRRQVCIENDANCFALSEALNGAGAGHRVVFGVIVGTGTGGGLVVDGNLINGPHRISGEWGHNPLPWRRDRDGATRCYCGKLGCIETFLSGPGLGRHFEARYGRARSSREIVAAAERGDADCRGMMAAYHDQMARALALLINILDPDAIVLGGGMSNIDSIYTEVPKLLPDYVFSDFVTTPILRAAHGDASGVFGAALLGSGPGT